MARTQQTARKPTGGKRSRRSQLRKLPSDVQRLVVDFLPVADWCALRQVSRAARDGLIRCRTSIRLRWKQPNEDEDGGDACDLIFLLVQLPALTSLAVRAGDTKMISRLAPALDLRMWGDRITRIVIDGWSGDGRRLGAFLRALTPSSMMAQQPVPLLAELVLLRMNNDQGRQLAKTLEQRKACGLPGLCRLEGIGALDTDILGRVLHCCMDTLTALCVEKASGLGGLAVALEQAASAAALEELRIIARGADAGSPFLRAMCAIGEGKAPVLQTLIFAHCDGSAAIADAVADAIACGHWTALTTLEFSSCTGQVLVGLPRLLTAAASLRSLKLYNTTWGDVAGFVAVAAALKKNGCCPLLETLVLVNMIDSSEAMAALGEALAQGPCGQALRTLTILSCYRVDADGMKAFASATIVKATALPALESLTVECKDLECLRQLTIALVVRAAREQPVRWQKVKIVESSDWELDDPGPGLELIATVLHHNALALLTSLTYDGWAPATGIQSLMTALKANTAPRLQTLELLGPTVENDAAQALADVLWQRELCPTWRCLMIRSLASRAAADALNQAASEGQRVLEHEENVEEDELALLGFEL